MKMLILAILVTVVLMKNSENENITENSENENITENSENTTELYNSDLIENSENITTYKHLTNSASRI